MKRYKNFISEKMRDDYSEHGFADLAEEFRTRYRIITVDYNGHKYRMLQFKDGKNMFGNDIWKFIPDYRREGTINKKPCKRLFWLDDSPFDYIHTSIGNDDGVKWFVKKYHKIGNYFEEHKKEKEEDDKNEEGRKQRENDLDNGIVNL